MKKIFMIFLCSLFAISTNAANICVRPNVSMMVLDYSVAPTSVVTVDSTTGTWRAEFDFGVIEGMSWYNMSSGGAGFGNVSGDQSGVTTANANDIGYCRCKITKPVESKSIHTSNVWIRNVKTECVKTCVRLVSGDTTMRRALFNNILLP